MARVTLIVTALVIALVGAFSSTTMAQDTRDRTFLTFSGAVEMPPSTWSGSNPERTWTRSSVYCTRASSRQSGA